MQHFPIFLDTKSELLCQVRVNAPAKLRIILKTEAEVFVFGDAPLDEINEWERAGRLTFYERPLKEEDLENALLLYAANDDEDLDQAVAALGRKAGVKTLIVDNLDESDFISPAIVDRDPVTVAVGTEGAAPVLARRIKADIEEMLPQSLGILARIGKAFRPMVTRLPLGEHAVSFGRAIILSKVHKLWQR